MKYIEDIPLVNLREDIEQSESVDYLLEMRRTFKTREDMTDGEREYYNLKIEKRIGELVLK